MKNNKGITLIALVITIIVLIILAGISISILMGEDGLITKAKQGTLNYQNAAIEEQAMLNSLYRDFASEIAKSTDSNQGTTPENNQSFQTFRRTIAQAITDAGIPTSENDSAETMATNIGQIATAASTSHADIYYLGTGTSFDLKTLLPDIDYSTLSNSNFIVESVASSNSGGIKNSGTNGAYSSDDWRVYHKTVASTKNYDASTGVLQANTTSYLWFGSRYSGSHTQTGNVKAYLVVGEIASLSVDRADIYYLGTGTSFDLNFLLANLDYSGLTSDNFIVESVDSEGSSGIKNSGTNSAYSSDDWRVYHRVNASTKNFDANTGVFQGNSNSYLWFGSRYSGSHTQTGNIKAYLVLKPIQNI